MLAQPRWQQELRPHRDGRWDDGAVPELLVLDCDALEVAEQTLRAMTLEGIDTDLDVIRQVGPRAVTT